MPIKPFLFFLIHISAVSQFKTPPESSVAFDKIILFDHFISEGASIGDIDNDGDLDIISGVLWWKGPDFAKSFSYEPVKTFPTTGPGLEGYSTNFLTFPMYIDADNWIDVLKIGVPGLDSYWIKNPGQNPFGNSNTTARKKLRIAQEHICNESPQIIDVIGDERKELLAYIKGTITIGIPDADPSKWEALAISSYDPKRFSKYTHGLGAGDINGDGLLDIIEKKGWWEQPINWNQKTPWKFHAYAFSPGEGGAQMFAYDIDGDGDNDVITSMNAHGYGLSWHEQIIENNKINFSEHLIITDKPEGNPYGVCFSQLHAMVCVDVDNDGLKDIITGKRYYAHNGRDLGAEDPAVLYWFKTTRNVNGTVAFIPYEIDNDSGVGVQISSGDLNKDGKIDIVVGNKKGVFAFIQK
jgi:hypothetical protein